MDNHEVAMTDFCSKYIMEEEKMDDLKRLAKETSLVPPRIQRCGSIGSLKPPLKKWMINVNEGEDDLNRNNLRNKKRIRSKGEKETLAARKKSNRKSVTKASKNEESRNGLGLQEGSMLGSEVTLQYGDISLSQSDVLKDLDK